MRPEYNRQPEMVQYYDASRNPSHDGRYGTFEKYGEAPLKVLRSESADLKKLLSVDLTVASQYLLEVKKRLPDATLEEIRHGYEDWEFMFEYWEDETEDERSGRLSREAELMEERKQWLHRKNRKAQKEAELKKIREKYKDV